MWISSEIIKQRYEYCRFPEKATVLFCIDPLDRYVAGRIAVMHQCVNSLRYSHSPD